MFKLGIATVVAALAGLLAPGSATAQGWVWLENSPVTGFSEGDWDALHATIQTVLDSKPDGSTTTWASSETDSSGDLTPVSTSRHGDQTCRRLRIVLRGRGQRSTLDNRLCKQPDGVWKVVP